jgi:hypothetical protein
VDADVELVAAAAPEDMAVAAGDVVLFEHEDAQSAHREVGGADEAADAGADDDGIPLFAFRHAASKAGGSQQACKAARTAALRSRGGCGARGSWVR